MIQVTAGIIEKDGKILIAKRKRGKSADAKWEFPGGKVEKGETHEECLKREILEELNVEIQVGKFAGSSCFNNGEKNINLIAYYAEYVSGEIKLTDHEDYRWVLPCELVKYDFLEADLKFVEIIY